jgi:hypothetical protein
MFGYERGGRRGHGQESGGCHASQALSPGEGSKYWWYDVEVLKVLKNDSAESFTNKLSVAAYGGKPGVPAGVSTIYLERYNPTEKKYWKLVGGEASTGVSHNTK